MLDAMTGDAARLVGVDPRGEQTVQAPACPYNLLTLIFGWWSLAGVFCVIKALADNFRGGIDVTSNVLAAARGEPLLPRRGDGLERRW